MGVMVSTVLLVADAEGTAVLAPLDAGGLVVSLRPGLVGVCCCSTLACVPPAAATARGPRDEYLQQSCTISVAMAMS
jgi:hypothetical protein